MLRHLDLPGTAPPIGAQTTPPPGPLPLTSMRPARAEPFARRRRPSALLRLRRLRRPQRLSRATSRPRCLPCRARSSASSPEAGRFEDRHQAPRRGHERLVLRDPRRPARRAGHRHPERVLPAREDAAPRPAASRPRRRARPRVARVRPDERSAPSARGFSAPARVRRAHADRRRNRRGSRAGATRAARGDRVSEGARPPQAPEPRGRRARGRSKPPRATPTRPTTSRSSAGFRA